MANSTTRRGRFYDQQYRDPPRRDYDYGYDDDERGRAPYWQEERRPEGRRGREYYEDTPSPRGHRQMRHPHPEDARFLRDQEYRREEDDRYGYARPLPRREAYYPEDDRYHETRYEGEQRYRHEQEEEYGEHDRLQPRQRRAASAKPKSKQQDKEENLKTAEIRPFRAKETGKSSAGPGRGWHGDPEGHARAGSHSHDNVRRNASASASAKGSRKTSSRSTKKTAADKKTQQGKEGS